MLFRQCLWVQVFDACQYEKHTLWFTKYSSYTIHDWSCPGEKDEIIQSRLKGSDAGNHKRTFGQEKQSLYYATFPKLMFSIIYVGMKTILTTLWYKLTKKPVFETGGITGVQKGINCTVHYDTHIAVECSPLPHAISLPCLLKLGLVVSKNS